MSNKSEPVPLAKVAGELSTFEAEAATEFLAAFGMAIFAACQLQYRLAHLYGATFETVRDGCLPRVQEKIYEGLKKPLGGAVRLAIESSALTGELLREVEFAHELRNYIAHRLFIETRGQQHGEGFRRLAERLRPAVHLFKHVEQQLDERHIEVLVKTGIPRDVVLAHRKEWDELDDEPITRSRGRPSRTHGWSRGRRRASCSRA
jgi:hypothetical protein